MLNDIDALMGVYTTPCLDKPINHPIQISSLVWGASDCSASETSLPLAAVPRPHGRALPVLKWFILTYKLYDNIDGFGGMGFWTDSPNQLQYQQPFKAIYRYPSDIWKGPHLVRGIWWSWIQKLPHLRRKLPLLNGTSSSSRELRSGP